MYELFGFTLFLAIILIPIGLGALEWRVKNKPLKAILAIVLLFGGYQCIWIVKDLQKDFEKYRYNIDLGLIFFDIKTTLENEKHAELLQLLEAHEQGDLFYSPETEDIRTLSNEIKKLNELSSQISE